MRSRHRALPEERREAFRERGFNSDRPFFPHRLHRIPRAGPDAMVLAEAMCGVRRPGALWEVLLTAAEPVASEFPASLYFDDDLVWHGQHLGMTGHVAYALLAESGPDLYGLNYVSDLVQRRRRSAEFGTRLHSRFRRWHHLLLNGLVAFAVERGYRRFHSPTADWVIAHTDPDRTVGRELFDRIYDRCLETNLAPPRSSRWWRIDVQGAAEWPVRSDAGSETIRAGTTVCVLHDVEGGWGHRDVDPELAREADARAPARLEATLQAERDAGVRSTYSVVGALMEEMRGPIEAAEHALAFHSYDHRRGAPQLERCREVDYRIPGYRPPRSVLTRELRDRNLARHNFAWISAAARELGHDLPTLERGIVKIPILLDDHPVHRGEMSFGRWREHLLDAVQEKEFVAFGLHDCYADHWLPHYRELLRELQELAELRTMDDVSHHLSRAAAV